MALNPTAKTNYLAKATIGDVVYWLKDAELRELLNSAATKTAIESIITAGEGINNNHNTIPTTKALVDWLEAQIQGLTGAMHFAGVTDPNSGDTFEERVAALYGTETPEAGDIVIDGTAEYVFDGTQWKTFGDEGVYVTKPELEVALQSLSVAGVAMGADKAITASELITALGLKALAFKDNASGDFTAVAASQTLTGLAKAGTYGLQGQAITVPQSFSALDVTPNGAVAITQQGNASATYDKATSATISATDNENGNYTPAGSVNLSGATTTVNLGKEPVATVTDPGTSYTMTEGAVTKANDTTSLFAIAGVTVSIDPEDDECLVFSDATTQNAVTASGAVTYTAPALSGALPTFGTKDVATSATAVTELGQASFAGTKVQISAQLEQTATQATVIQPVFAAEFTGTEKSVTPVAASTASVAPANANVEIASEDKAITLATETKTVQVS